MNAGLGVVVDETGGLIFKARAAGGVDNDGVQEMTIYNKGAVDASLKVDDMHATVAVSSDENVEMPLAADQRFPLPAGLSATIRRKRTAAEPCKQIMTIHARGEGGDATLDFGVNED